MLLSPVAGPIGPMKEYSSQCDQALTKDLKNQRDPAFLHKPGLHLQVQGSIPKAVSYPEAEQQITLDPPDVGYEFRHHEDNTDFE